MQVAFMFLLAVFNTLLGLVDQLRYGRRIRDQQLHPQPIIILGHFRTGTTLLQNLMTKVRKGTKGSHFVPSTRATQP